MHAKTFLLKFVVLALVIALANEIHAGAWVRPAGDVYLRMATKFYQANNVFDPDGNRVSGDWWDEKASFSEVSINFIGEVGIWDFLTLTLENSTKFMHSDYSPEYRDDVRVNGFSDLWFGFRYGPYQKDLVLAFEAKVELPTGYAKHDEHVRLGPGFVNGQFKVLFGGALPIGISNYFDTYFGYRLRGGSFADDLLFAGSVGIESIEDLWFRVGLSGVYNLGEPRFAAPGSIDGSYLAGGVAATYLFENGFGLELGASVDLWGRNTFAGYGFEVVVQYEIK